MLAANNFFVITGGPSSGKTTLVETLKKKGYRGIDEAARIILQEEESRGGDVKAYRNTVEFTELEFQRSLAYYIQAHQENPHGLTFFDRGIPDIIAYARFRKIPISTALDDAARTYRYNKKVFIAPPWHEIYHADEERTESYTEATRLFHAIEKTYQEYGYSLVELPKRGVEIRVNFVMEYCEMKK